MTPFDFQLRTRIVFGYGAIDRLGDLAEELGCQRVLVVSDPGIVKAGHVDRGILSLKRAGMTTELFGQAQENPTTRDVAAGLEVAKAFKPDLLVGLGGGSSMDCAKGVNFLYSCGGEMKDYWGVGKATADMLPMIAVPTTAGTGSEMQSFALISDEHTHAKMACGDKRASCKVALLDPNLTLTQPREVTALSGVDALSHALETYVTTTRNPASLHFSAEAWRLLSMNFQRVLDNPDDVEARAGMQLGAAYCGVAIENSMLGASHALANPLTAAFGTSHGQAVGVMLPHVIKFNGEKHNDWYENLLRVTKGQNGAPEPAGGSLALSDYVKSLVAAAGLNTKLQDCGVPREQLGDLAVEAAKQWTGNFNPREVDEQNLLGIYERAY